MPDPRARSADPTQGQRDTSRAVSSAHRTAVVTDTTAYLPDELAAEHDIHRISLYVTLDGVQQRESDIDSASYGDFFERLRRSDEGATHLPALGRRLRLALRAAARRRARHRLDPHLAGDLGHLPVGAAGARAARRVAAPAASAIQVIDSRTGCGGQGMMCLVAARAAGAGARRGCARRGRASPRDAEDVVLPSTRSSTCARVGGSARRRRGSDRRCRSSRSSRWRRRSCPVERVRTRRRAFERMVEFARERQRAGAGAWVVQHIHDPEHGPQLVDAAAQVFGSRARVRLGGRPGDRRPRRPRPARRRRDPDRRCCPAERLASGGGGAASSARRPRSRRRRPRSTISRRCSRTCPRQSVSSVTRPRSASTECDELLALAFDVARGSGPRCARVRAAAGRATGSPAPLWQAPRHGARSLTGGSRTGRLLAAGCPPLSVSLISLALLDRQVRHRRRARLDDFVGEHAGDRGDHERGPRPRQEAPQKSCRRRRSR